MHEAIEYIHSLFLPDDYILVVLIFATPIPGSYPPRFQVDVKQYKVSAFSEKTVEQLQIKNDAGFHVYVCMNAFAKQKPPYRRRKVDVAGLRTCYVELDYLGDERLAAINIAVASGEIPAPHFVLQSSPHKFHVVWKIAGVTDNAVQESLNRALQVKFGGDAAAVDSARVLRLPGFKNVKEKYGPDFPLVSIVQRSETPRSALADFHVEIKAAASHPPPGDAVSEDRLSFLFKKIENVLTRCNASPGPWDPVGDGEWRCNVRCPNSNTHSDGRLEAMLFLYSDGHFGFKCLHGHECPELNWKSLFEWMKKQLPGENLDDFEPPELSELEKTVTEFNKKFFVVENFGSHTQVCWFQEVDYGQDHKGRVLGHQSFEDFRNRYSHQEIVFKYKQTAHGDTPVIKSRGDAWLHSKDRQQYDRVTFLPGGTTPTNVMNLWQGFAYKPIEGNCGLYLDHLRDNVCDKNAEKYNYLISWMAYHVRHPAAVGEVAIVIRGKKGVGKNVAAEPYQKLWGPHGLLVSDQNAITGNFNAYLRDKCLVVADEAFFAGDHAGSRRLKSIITGDTLQIESKGVNKETCPNYIHLFILGNDDWIIRATDDERRFFVTECGSDHRQDFPYFKAIQEQLNSGGYEALLFHLLHKVDLAGFENHQSLPTPELREQMSHSLEGIEAGWFECLMRGELPGKRESDNSWLLSTSDQIEWTNENEKWSKQKITAQHVGDLFGDNPHYKQKVGMKFGKIQDTSRHRAWVIPSLDKCRELWDERRFKHDWPSGDGGWSEANWQPRSTRYRPVPRASQLPLNKDRRSQTPKV